MKDENHVMKNLQTKYKLVRRHKKMWEIDIKFGVLMFEEIREGLESFRVRNIIFLKKICINIFRNMKKLKTNFTVNKKIQNIYYIYIHNYSFIFILGLYIYIKNNSFIISLFQLIMLYFTLANLMIVVKFINLWCLFIY